MTNLIIYVLQRYVFWSITEDQFSLFNKKSDSLVSHLKA